MLLEIFKLYMMKKIKFDWRSEKKSWATIKTKQNQGQKKKMSLDGKILSPDSSINLSKNVNQIFSKSEKIIIQINQNY